MYFVGDDVVQFVKDCLDAHKLVIRTSLQGLYSCQSAITEIKDLQSRAAARLVLQQYTNQLLGPLINVALFGLIRGKYPTETSIISRNLNKVTKSLNVFLFR